MAYISSFSLENTALTASVDVVLPGIISAGNHIFIHAIVTSSGQNAITASGFTIIAPDEGVGIVPVGGAARAVVLHKVADEGDSGATVTVTSATTGRWSITGWVGDAAILSSHAYSSVTSTSNDLILPTVTPPPGAQGGTVVYFLGATGTSGSQPSFSPALGTTLRTQIATSFASGTNVGTAMLDLPFTGDNTLNTGNATVNPASNARVWGYAVLSDAITPALPVAIAGPDQLDIEPFSLVVLDSTESYSNNGDIASQVWRQISGDPVILSSATQSRPTFIAPASFGGATLIFGLVVTDLGGLESIEDTVQVMILPHDNYILRDGVWIAVPAPRVRRGSAWL